MEISGAEADDLHERDGQQFAGGRAVRGRPGVGLSGRGASRAFPAQAAAFQQIQAPARGWAYALHGGNLVREQGGDAGAALGHELAHSGTGSQAGALQRSRERSVRRSDSGQRRFPHPSGRHPALLLHSGRNPLLSGHLYHGDQIRHRVLHCAALHQRTGNQRVSEGAFPVRSRRAEPAHAGIRDSGRFL